MKLNHAEIVKDYNKLIRMYDVPDDLTGGLVVEEVLMRAVETGTKLACAKAILHIIEYGFQQGGGVYRYQYGGHYREVSTYDCEYIKYIYEKYID